jgi:CBS domain-containing protein
MPPHATTKPVYDVMTRAPMTVTPQTQVRDLVALFDRYDFNAFPVVDQNGIVRGIVTKLDVLRLLRPDENLFVPGLARMGSAQVNDIMRHSVVSVEAGDPLVVAADLMVETRLRSLPVVRRLPKGPVLAGIVSQGDLLRGLRFALAETEARGTVAGSAVHEEVGERSVVVKPSNRLGDARRHADDV